MSLTLLRYLITRFVQSQMRRTGGLYSIVHNVISMAVTSFMLTMIVCSILMMVYCFLHLEKKLYGDFSFRSTGLGVSFMWSSHEKLKRVVVRQKLAQNLLMCMDIVQKKNYESQHGKHFLEEVIMTSQKILVAVLNGKQLF